MHLTRTTALAIALVTALAVPAIAQADATYFRSPSGNIQCEFRGSQAEAKQFGTFVYCQIREPAQSVSLKTNSRLRICRPETAQYGCLGDTGDNTVITLGYGKRITADWGYCASSRNGVTCKVKKTGRGFTISRAGVEPIR